MIDAQKLEAQKLDLARALHVAWHKYTGLLGEPPHGTLTQIRAMLELMPLGYWGIKGIQEFDCAHPRLDEDGICRSCGEDRRAI